MVLRQTLLAVAPADRLSVVRSAFNVRSLFKVARVSTSANRAHIRAVDRSVLRLAANREGRAVIKGAQGAVGRAVASQGWPCAASKEFVVTADDHCAGTLVAIYLAGRSSSRLPYLPVHLCPRFRPFSYRSPLLALSVSPLITGGYTHHTYARSCALAWLCVCVCVCPLVDCSRRGNSRLRIDHRRCAETRANRNGEYLYVALIVEDFALFNGISSFIPAV